MHENMRSHEARAFVSNRITLRQARHRLRLSRISRDNPFRQSYLAFRREPGSTVSISTKKLLPHMGGYQ